MNTNVVSLADHKARKRKLPTCTNTECGKLMRPKDTLKTDFPGTVASGHSGKCKTCVKPVVDKPKERKPRKVRTEEQKDVRLENTVAGLDRFLSRRFARGVKPENIRYFDGRPLGRSAA